MNDEFPSNSNSQRDPRREARNEPAPSEKKEVVRITRNKATLRKRPLRKRIADAFAGDGNQGVAEYIFLEVLVPGIKDVVVDTSTTAIERALYGDSVGRSSRRRGGGGGGYTSYNRMSEARPRGRRDRDDDRRPARRRSSDLPEAIVETRVEAEEVVDNMYELLSKYDVVTMRDLLGMIGEPHSTTDEDWGWTDLRGTRIHRIGGGYLIDLPRPEPLD